MHRSMRILASSLVLCAALSGLAFAGATKGSRAATGGADAGLPPLSERLPLEPKVVVPGTEVPAKDLDLRIGKRGGTMRLVHASPNWNAILFIMANEPLVNAPGVGVREPGVIHPNVVKAYEVTDGDTVFTFYLREGMKWSDGVPVTTDDVRFTYEDVLQNRRVTPTFPQFLRSANKNNGTPMELEILDDHTFRVRFDEPYGGFLTNLALVGWQNYTALLKPRHYLEQFHADYTPMEELAPMIAKEELSEEEWWTLFNSRDLVKFEFMDPGAEEFPSLAPWVASTITQERTTFQRNPYYWKVDQQGNQLPYIDTVFSDLVQDVEMISLKVMSGEIDFTSYGAGGVSLSNLPVLRENAERGGYTVPLLGVHNTPTNVFINLTHPNPVWRQVVRDVRFRRALNMAINRQEIIEAVYYGFAKLPTSVPSEYNPDGARKLLDEMGLDKRDAEGWRIGPDGTTFEVPFEIAKNADDIVPVTELCAEYFREIGLKTTIKTMDVGLRGQANTSNELHISVIWNATLTMWWQIWGLTPGVGWGPAWNTWFTTNGAEGEEPPEEAKRFVNLIYESVAVNPTSQRRKDVIEEYLGILHDQLYAMPTAVDVLAPVVVNKRIRNIAHEGFAIAAYHAAELFYFE
jgi:peptide/nickel transport system substrate-binding protein